jgi:hypothetical protein
MPTQEQINEYIGAMDACTSAKRDAISAINEQKSVLQTMLKEVVGGR